MIFSQRWPVLGPVILVCLLSLLPAWRLGYRSFFTARWPIASAVLCLVLPFLFAYPAFYIPFYLSKDATVGPYVTLIDLLLYSVFPLGAIALLAYVIDFMAEKPTMVLIACAACTAIALLPIAYLLFADQMHTEFGITIQESSPQPTAPHFIAPQSP